MIKITLLIFISILLIGLSYQQTIVSTTQKITTITYPYRVLGCSFEKDFCSWTNDVNAKANWTRNNGPTITDFTGPISDVTTQSTNGTYIYIDSVKSALNDTARLLSPPITLKPTGYCFTFWYHMYGKGIETLNLNLESLDNNTSNTLWTRKFNQGAKWKQAVVSVKFSGNYRFVLEAVSGRSIYGDIAVDEINTNFGSCPASKICDFENEDICGFTNYPAKFDWTRHKGNTSTPGTGPSYDHTTYTENGYYMYIQSSYPRVSGDNAILMSPSYTYYVNSRMFCVELWYHAYGYDIGKLNIYLQEKKKLNLTTSLLYSMRGDQGNEWHITQINFQPPYGNSFNILIEGVLDESYDWYDYYPSVDRGDIAIDDYELKEKPCQPLGNCDFEDDLCAWKNAEKNTQVEWVRHRGSTQTALTGPSVDHTLGTPFGTYIYFETSYPTLYKDTARLVSPVFDGKSNRCFEFYYHMLTSSPLNTTGGSTLNIIKKTYRSTLNGTILWTANKNYGDVWNYGSISIPSSGFSNYILIIEAIAGYGFNDDIAMDDFKIRNGELCPPIDYLCAFKCPTNDKCITEAQVCNFIGDCPNSEDESDCGYKKIDFDNNNYEKWNISSDGQYKWILGNNGDEYSSPSTDHTFGTTSGKYLYLGKNILIDSDKNARFRSPLLKDSSASCQVDFWYKIKGKNIGSLEVYSHVGAQKARLLKLTSETDGQWVKANAFIGRLRNSFHVSFEAYKLSNSYGYISIDDIDFINCGLPPTNSSSCITFKCENKACISSLKVCDFTDDCGDMSDESNSTCSSYPKKCNFENGFCEWVNNDLNEFNWKRTSGQYAESDILPRRDHTTNTDIGNYIYIETKDKPAGKKSTVFGPIFDGYVSSQCDIRFYYYMFGNSVGRLSVSVRTTNGGAYSERWSKYGSVGQYWERVTSRIGGFFTQGQVFQVLIEAQNGNSTKDEGVIAIDDITFSTACRPSTVTALETIVTTTRKPVCGNGFQCSNFACINQTQLCDFRVDCPNGEDEANCGTCDFEKNSCGWLDNSYGDHIWNRTKASETEISKDQTLGTSNGSFAFYELADGSVNGLTRLYSPVLRESSTHCEFQFYFYKFDRPEKSILFSLFLIDFDNDVERLWKTDRNSLNNDWQRVTVGLHSRTPGFRLYFEASHIDDVYSFYKPQLAIDDTSFINCASNLTSSCSSKNVFKCENKLCIPDSLVCDFSDDCGDGSDEANCTNYTRCDFESDSNSLCNWNNDDDADLYWKRDKGNTVTSQYYYPKYDHTTLSPKGSYFRNDERGKSNATSRLSSPVFFPTNKNQKCFFRFWYYLIDYSPDYGSAIRVSKRTIIGGDLITVWEKPGIYEYDWVLASVPFESNVNFQIVVEAFNGPNEYRNVAIDDFSLTPGCVINPIEQLPSNIFTTPTPDKTCTNFANAFRCKKSRECVDMSSLCNFRYDCKDGSDEETCPSVCAFGESDLCGWNNELKGNDKLQPKMIWKVDKGDISDRNQIKPLLDHTTVSPNGYYLYLDPGYGKNPGDLARIVSPIYNQAGIMCTFEFWYVIYGNQTGTINIYLRSSLTDSLIGIINNESTIDWKQFKVSLPTCSSQFQIVVEGVRGGSNDSVIALDDFRFTNCEYEKPKPDECKQGGQFKCSSGHCVSVNSICDLNSDCCDGSDEGLNQCSKYYTCSFENDLCMFKNVNESDFIWTRTRSDQTDLSSNFDTSLFIKPFLDHTLRSSRGHYLLFTPPEGSTSDQKSTIAVTFSSLNKTANGCKMRLWYWLTDNQLARLEIKKRKTMGGSVDNLLTLEQTSINWIRTDINIEPDSTPFQILIDGVVKSADNQRGFLALDDVTFTPDCKLTDFELNIPIELENKPDKPSGRNSGLAVGITVPLVLIILALIGIGYYRYKNNGNVNGLFSFLKFGSKQDNSTSNTLSFNKSADTNPELSMSNPSFD